MPASAFSLPSAEPFAFNMPAAGRVGLLMIDWQRDFLEEGGFGHVLGNDVTPLQRALQPAAAVLAAGRACGIPVIHTLEAHDTALANCPPAKRSRCNAIGTVLDASRGRVLVAGEPGNAIVEAVAPLPSEEVVHKPGKGAFWNTDLEAHLERLGITHLIVTGVTTEVCVQTTMREANDRGYDCVVVADATESYFPEFKKATLEMIVAQGAIVGWACQSADVVSALKGHSPLPPPSAPRAAAAMKRTLLAVSGTLQCGFELRANLDHPEWTAVLVGSAVVRGVRAHLDIKEPGCREHRASADGHARVNPANVVTGDPTDANLYAVYLVHEAVVLKALLGEPRYLAIAPDAVRLDLTAPHTSPAVRALLAAAARDVNPNAPPPSECAILTVLSTYKAPSFVELPKLPAAQVGRGREGDAAAAASAATPLLTSFPEGLAAFAKVPFANVTTPGAAEAALREAEAVLGAAKRKHGSDETPCAAARAVLASGPPPPPPSVRAPVDEPWRPRLAALWDGPQLAKYAAEAGFGAGGYGDELAALTV